MAFASRPLAKLEWDEVDLDSMTRNELQQEQAAVKAEIASIEYQLADEEGVYRLGINYPDWRRRARAALWHRKDELRQINALLQRPKTAQPKTAHPEAVVEAKNLLFKRQEADRLAADPASLDVLLARVMVAFRHLAGEGNGLPDTVLPSEKEALKRASRYLTGRFGARWPSLALEGEEAV